MAGYYVSSVKPLLTLWDHWLNLLSKKAKFEWSDHNQKGFDQVKNVMLTPAPLLMAPDFDKLFKLVIDTSNMGVGVVLVQEEEEV